jgi:hypothetical protein
MSEASSALIGRFVRFSAVMTAFTSFDLYGTGRVAEYFNVLATIAGNDVLNSLFDTFESVMAASTDHDETRTLLRARILSNSTYGPLTRNILKLWYLGTWYQLPPEWRALNGARWEDTTRVVSPVAYTEGLLWPAIGANPSGAKAPGYGSWQYPPDIPAPPPNSL